jgi:hypothetical protein
VLVSLAEWREFSESTDKVFEALRKDIIKARRARDRGLQLIARE